MFINTGELDDPYQSLMKLTEQEGFSDMLVMIPSAGVLEFSQSLLGFNGCLNFFAGPTDTAFSAKINYYDVHYFEKHIIGTTGGNVDDMREALSLMADDLVRPEALISHIGGLDAVAETTLQLPSMPGGKKLIYTGLKLPLVSLEEILHHRDQSELYAGLAPLLEANQGLWSVEAERYLLAHGEKLS